MAAAWNDLPATGGLHECAALVSSAEALRVSAPELSVQLARRALLVGATDASGGANAGEIRNLSMRAQALLASGLVRISQHPKAVEPAFSALALAESGGAPDVAAAMRIDLAACAQQVGEPLLGAALLRPVLQAAQTLPAVRAAALGRLVGCVAHVSRRDDVEDALAEADRLLAADSGIGADVRRMERARLAVRTAGYHRWYGDTEDAITAAREGLNLLTRLRDDLRSESDRLRARLVLELVCGLLDEGELREAEAAAHPIVDEPVRATSAASVGRLMLAVATRLYLPSGQMDRGRHLLDQAAWLGERHTLDGLRADALTEVSRLDEQAGRAGDALEAMRAARAAEHRRMRAVSRAARIVLVEVGAGHGINDTAQQSVATLMRQLAHPAGLPVAVAPPAQVAPAASQQAPEPQPATPELVGTVDMAQHDGNGLLDREGLFNRMRSVRKGERPVALTLVRVEPTRDTDRGPDTGIMTGLADKVRDMAPDNAELARSDGSELAVLLPAATRDQAEEFAATIRESDWPDATGKDMSISTGVVHTDHTTTDDEAGILTAARDAMTPAQANSLTDTAAAAQPALSEDTPTKPLNSAKPADPQQQAGRSILSSLSIPTGSGGRRRAGEEQPPGAKSTWPAEAPRSTRAERRAKAAADRPADPDPAPGTDWPLPADEPSQGKRAATPTRPSFSETRVGEATTAIDRTHLTNLATEPGQTTRRIHATAPPPTSQPTTSESPTAPDPTTGHRATAPPPLPVNAEVTGAHGTPAASASNHRGADVPDGPAAQDLSAGRSTAAASVTAPGSAGAAPLSGHQGADVPDGPAVLDLLMGRGAASAAASGFGAASSDQPGAGAPEGPAAQDPLMGRGADAAVAAGGFGAVSGDRPGVDVPEGPAAQGLVAGRGAASLAASGFGAVASDRPGTDVPEGPAVQDLLMGRGAASSVAASGLGSVPGGQPGAGAPEGPAAQDSLTDRSAAPVTASAPGAPGGSGPAASSSSVRGGQADGPAAQDVAAGLPGAPAGAEASGVPGGSGAAALSSSLRISGADGPATQDAWAGRSTASTADTADSSGAVSLSSFARGGGADGPAAREVPSADSATAGSPGQAASAALPGPSPAPGAADVPPAPDVTTRRQATLDAAQDLPPRDSTGAGLAGLSSGGTLLGASGTDRAEESKRSSYEETKAELARMMSALNAKSLAARERSAARQPNPAPPEPPARSELPEPSEPETGGRSRLMAAFDALTGPVPGLRAEFDDAAELPARRPAESWAELETAGVVESPADELFGAESADRDAPRSSLGAAFAEFDTVEKKVTEPVKETVQEPAYDQPIGPEPRPADLPRRGEKSSATIASLLTEALAAYQSTAEDSETHGSSDRFGSYLSDDREEPPPGARGRHRSPE